MQAFFYLKRKPHQSHRFWKLEHSVCIETVALPPVIPMCSALPAVCIINTVRCLALYFETALRCFKKVAECAAFLLVEAAAAGIAFILRRLSFYQNGIFTAAVFRIVHTSGYTTIQFCHDFSSCFLTCITESLLRHPAGKLFSDTLFNVSWFLLLFTHV
mgnify:CR=1 FL=1